MGNFAFEKQIFFFLPVVAQICGKFLIFISTAGMRNFAFERKVRAFKTFETLE